MNKLHLTYENRRGELSSLNRRIELNNTSIQVFDNQELFDIVLPKSDLFFIAKKNKKIYLVWHNEVLFLNSACPFAVQGNVLVTTREFVIYSVETIKDVLRYCCGS